MSGRVQVPSDREVTAIHEAGHAVVGTLQGRELRYATINDVDEGDGYPRCRFEDDYLVAATIHDKPRYWDFKREDVATTETAIRATIISSFAGPFAEMRYLGLSPESTDWDNPAYEGDWLTINGCLCWRLSSDEAISNARRAAEAHTIEILDRRSVWFAIEVLAEQFRFRLKVDGAEVRHLVNETMPPSERPCEWQITKS